MRVSLLALSSALILAACSSAQTDETGQTTSSTASATSTQTGEGASASSSSSANSSASASGETSAYSYKQDNALYAFTYNVPAVPTALANILKRDAQSNEAKLKALASEGKRERDSSDFPFHPYEQQHSWKKVADIPGFLSLSEDIYAFTGGAHGNSGFDTLIWDKKADTERKPIDFFTSPAALNAAIRPAFCKQLAAEQRKKRGGDVDAAGDGFSDCIDPLEQTMILGSSNGKTFDRLGFLIGPYAAGPYAEGSYEVTLPVTKAVRDQVKADYADSFSVMR